MKKVISVLISAALLITLLGACGAATKTPIVSSASSAPVGSSAPASSETAAPNYNGGSYNLVFASNTGESAFQNSAYGQAILKFIDEVDKRSNGQIKIDLYKGGAMGSTVAELVGGVQQGSFAFTNWTTANLGEYTDAFMPFNIPFLFSDVDQVHKLVDSEIGGEMIDQAIEDSGMRVLVWLDMGFRHLTNNTRPIKTPEDVKGLKIRVQSDKYQIAAIEALGASATTIPFSELYAAMQQKVVDGQENPMQNIVDNSFFEVQKYMTMTSHIFGQAILLMGNDQYESLSDEAKQVINESAAVAQNFCREKSEELEGSLLTTLKGKMEVTELTDEQLEAFKTKAKSAWDTIATDFGQDKLDRIISIVNG